MEERLKLTKVSTTVKVEATLYRSIIGGLRYLVHMRLNIAFAMGYVSRFMEDPREDHWAVVKHLLRYVKGMVDQGIIFPKTGGSRLQLTVFSNVDMAGDIDGWGSTSRVLIFLRTPAARCAPHCCPVPRCPARPAAASRPTRPAAPRALSPHHCPASRSPLPLRAPPPHARPLASTRWRCPAPAALPAHAHRSTRLEEEENIRAIRRPPEKEEDPAPPANPVHAVRRARPCSEQKEGEREEEEKGNRRREEAKKRGGGGAPPWPLDATLSVTLAPSMAFDVPPTSSRQHTITDDPCAAVITVDIDPCHRCFSDLVICSVVFRAELQETKRQSQEQNAELTAQLQAQQVAFEAAHKQMAEMMGRLDQEPPLQIGGSINRRTDARESVWALSSSTDAVRLPAPAPRVSAASPVPAPAPSPAPGARRSASHTRPPALGVPHPAPYARPHQPPIPRPCPCPPPAPGARRPAPGPRRPPPRADPRRPTLGPPRPPPRAGRPPASRARPPAPAPARRHPHLVPGARPRAPTPASRDRPPTPSFSD
ncbi:uncharacterized protein [Miscanthus floridulus]|uniref:uncharacterized protein n=1 Tax=Miscanthus floridulus TaxID=154761 RepID=UPI003459CC2C